jgi:hypothetical protein
VDINSGIIARQIDGVYLALKGNESDPFLCGGVFKNTKSQKLRKTEFMSHSNQSIIIFLSGKCKKTFLWTFIDTLCILVHSRFVPSGNC